MSLQKISHQVQWWCRHPVALFWRAYAEVYRKFHPDEPWLSQKAIVFLNQNLTKEMTGLEWGSGRSTIWFAQRLGHLTSVEHHNEWYSHVKHLIDQKKITNIDYLHITLDHPADAPTYPQYNPLPRYVDVIYKFPDQSLDFVLIDGHYRQACLAVSLGKIKSGGFLVVDNSNWMSLEEWGAPKDWPIVHKSMGFESETTVWRRP